MLKSPKDHPHQQSLVGAGWASRAGEQWALPIIGGPSCRWGWAWHFPCCPGLGAPALHPPAGSMPGRRCPRSFPSSSDPIPAWSRASQRSRGQTLQWGILPGCPPPSLDLSSHTDQSHLPPLDHAAPYKGCSGTAVLWASSFVTPQHTVNLTPASHH